MKVDTKAYLGECLTSKQSGKQQGTHAKGKKTSKRMMTTIQPCTTRNELNCVLHSASTSIRVELQCSPIGHVLLNAHAASV